MPKRRFPSYGTYMGPLKVPYNGTINHVWVNDHTVYDSLFEGNSVPAIFLEPMHDSFLGGADVI